MGRMTTDFLLELLSEEIPARMQARASADLARLFAERIALSGEPDASYFRTFVQARHIYSFVTIGRLGCAAPRPAAPSATSARHTPTASVRGARE